LINLATLSSVATTAKNLSNLILITPNKPVGYLPQPTANEIANKGKKIKDKDGIERVLENPEAFFFNYEGEQKISLNSQITDHYVEDNTAIADQIALAPEKITTNGFISELNDIVPDSLLPLNLIREKLVLVGEYTPELSRTAQDAYNRAKYLYDNALTISNNAVQTWESLTNVAQNKITQTKQQIAFQKFYGYWQARRLFTIQTPWAIFNNMAIESLNSVQGADTEVVSNFEVTFKKLRFSNTVLVINSSGPLGDFQSDRTNTAGATSVSSGTTVPKTSPTSFPYGVA